MNKRTFLDIDDTILMKNLILPVSDNNNNQTYFMLKLVYMIYIFYFYRKINQLMIN